VALLAISFGELGQQTAGEPGLGVAGSFVVSLARLKKPLRFAQSAKTLRGEFVSVGYQILMGAVQI